MSSDVISNMRTGPRRPSSPLTGVHARCSFLPSCLSRCGSWSAVACSRAMRAMEFLGGLVLSSFLPREFRFRQYKPTTECLRQYRLGELTHLFILARFGCRRLQPLKAGIVSGSPTARKLNPKPR